MNKLNQMNLETLPDFFKDVKIIGPATETIKRFKNEFEDIKNKYGKQEIQVKMNSTPILCLDNETKEIYQRGDFKALEKLKAAAQNDLGSIYDNIAKYEEAAWVEVEADHERFFMSWSATGTIWSYPYYEENENGEKVVCIQIGQYSQTGSILGIHTYNLGIIPTSVELALSLVIAIALSQIVARGLGFAVSALALLLGQAASRIGLSSFSFMVSSAAVINIAIALVTFLVFIGLSYLWDWANRKYTVRLQLFNWDEEFDWICNDEYHSNAKIPSVEQKEMEGWRIPRRKNKNETVNPPGFNPVILLDHVTSYLEIIWENDNTFLEGCSMALAVERDDNQPKKEGFMWAFDLPRLKDNRHKGHNRMVPAKDYLKDGDWNRNPKDFSITCTQKHIPINFYLNALSGAKDNLYEIIVHIKKC